MCTVSAKELCRCLRSLLYGTLPVHLICYANQGDHFLRYIIAGDETYVNCTAPATKNAFITWKQPSSPQQWNSEQYCQEGKSWDHKGLLPVGSVAIVTL